MTNRKRKNRKVSAFIKGVNKEITDDIMFTCDADREHDRWAIDIAFSDIDDAIKRRNKIIATKNINFWYQ